MSKNTLLFSFLFFLISITATAQVRVLDEVFTTVDITKDVPYGENYTILSGTPVLDTLEMDVYQPAGDTASKRPLIIILHGGSFLPKDLALPMGDKEDSAIVELCTQFAKRGYVAAAINYRIGWNPFAASQETKASTLVNAVYRGMQDAKTAIRYFNKDYLTGNTYRTDPDKVVLAGSDVGGHIALMAASLNKASEIHIPKLLLGNGDPMIDTSVTGGFDGEGGMTGFNIYNHAGFSSNFRMVLNLGGAIVDTTWMEQDELPVVSFHGISNPITPYYTDIMIISATGDPVIEVSGSHDLSRTANRLGLNDLFLNPGFFDNYSQVAKTRTPYEGLFPFPGAANGFEPYAWYDSSLNKIDSSGSGYGSQANPFATRAKAEQYIDTIMNYFAPRALTVFEDTSYQSPYTNNRALVSGTVYVDENGNGSRDAGEPAFKNQRVNITPSNFSYYSDIQGFYAALLPQGSYTVSTTPPKYWGVSSASSYSIVIDSTGADIDSLDFGIVVTDSVTDVSVNITTDVNIAGFNSNMWVNYANNGSLVTDGSITLHLDTNLTFLSAIPAADSIGQGVLKFNYTNLAPGDLESITIRVNNAIVLPNTPLICDASITPLLTDVNPANNFDTLQTIMFASYDPNDKQVLPARDDSLNYTLFDEDLTYTIRFQNTGNFMATNVRIEDTLDMNLDMSSFTLLGTSHPVEVEIKNRAIAFYFNNIMLPDSFSNEPASHGFVKFRVATNDSLPENTEIENTAFIYFDFNPEIVTNTVVNTLVEELPVDTSVIPSALCICPEEAEGLLIYPNPATDLLQVAVFNDYRDTEVELELYNLLGKKVLTTTPFVHQHRLNIAHLHSGVYLYRVQSESKVLRTGKLVIN